MLPYLASITADPAQIRACQRLRYQIFAGEFGARLHSTEPGLDSDEFDKLCDHLVVTHEPTAEVVGTYRLLPPGRSDRLYSDGEFDLSALDHLKPALVETGRSCVHAEHRSGGVINAMWAALGRYVLDGGHGYLAGCASVPLADGGRAASSTWQLAQAKHASPAELRVTPHRPWPPGEVERPSYAQVPPLLRGYLRLGAWVCGTPAYDPDFEVADFFVLLSFDHVNERYLHYFLGAAK